MLKLTAVLVGAALALSSSSYAQTPNEATRWVVSRGDNIQIDTLNAGVRPARVMVELYGANGARLGRLGEMKTIAPGSLGRFSDDTWKLRYDYAVIVSDEPVMVTTATVLNRIDNTPSTLWGSRPAHGVFWIFDLDTSSGVAPGRLRNIGNFQGWDWGWARVPAMATPINCAAAPAGHFICGLRLPFGSALHDQTAPRPRPPSPLPRAPEGREAPTPPPSVIPSTAPRVTPMPQRTLQ